MPNRYLLPNRLTSPLTVFWQGETTPWLYLRLVEGKWVSIFLPSISLTLSLSLYVSHSLYLIKLFFSCWGAHLWRPAIAVSLVYVSLHSHRLSCLSFLGNIVLSSTSLCRCMLHSTPLIPMLQLMQTTTTRRLLIGRPFRNLPKALRYQRPTLTTLTLC